MKKPEQIEEMKKLIVEQTQFIATWKPYAGREALTEMRRLAAEAVRLTGDNSLAIPEEEEEDETELPLFRARFKRNTTPFCVVFRRQTLESCAPYLRENFGEFIWDIKVEPVSQTAFYADLQPGYFIEE